MLVLVTAFCNEALNEVLNLSELSDQLDVREIF
jgi:hypothetical protein